MRLATPCARVTRKERSGFTSYGFAIAVGNDDSKRQIIACLDPILSGLERFELPVIVYFPTPSSLSEKLPAI